MDNFLDEHLFDHQVSDLDILQHLTSDLDEIDKDIVKAYQENKIVEADDEIDFVVEHHQEIDPVKC